MKLIDEEVAKIRQVVMDLFSPPGTAEVDALAKLVRTQMANYALAAIMDSDIRKEVIDVCAEEGDG